MMVVVQPVIISAKTLTWSLPPSQLVWLCTGSGEKPVISRRTAPLLLLGSLLRAVSMFLRSVEALRLVRQ